MKKGFKNFLLALMLVCLATTAGFANAGTIRKAANAALDKINTLDVSASNDIAVASIIHTLTFASYGRGSVDTDEEYNAHMALNNAAQLLAAPLDNASNDLATAIKKLAPRSGAIGNIDYEFEGTLTALLTGEEIIEPDQIEFNIKIGMKLADGVAEKLAEAAEKLSATEIKDYFAVDGALAAYVEKFEMLVNDYEENAEYADSEEKRIRMTNEKTTAEAFVAFYTAVSNDVTAFTGMLSGISAYLTEDADKKSPKAMLEYITNTYTDDGLVNVYNSQAVEATKAPSDAAAILSPTIATDKDGNKTTIIPANMGIVMTYETTSTTSAFTFDDSELDKVITVAQNALDSLTERTAEIDSASSLSVRDGSSKYYTTVATELTKAVYPGTIFTVRFTPYAAASNTAEDNYLEDFVIAGIDNTNLEENLGEEIDTLKIDASSLPSIVRKGEYIVTYSSLNGEIVGGFKDAVPLWGNIGGDGDGYDSSSKGSSSGCDAGLSALALLAFMPFVKKIRK